MGAALQRMLEEEPTARVERSTTGEQLLLAMGDAHIAVIGERLKRKFGAAIQTKQPKVPYRETIRGTTKVEGKYKKQTGGHGMFGHVWLEIEPNPGGGVEFTEKVVGGSVPKGFFPGIEKGIREAAAEGVLAGYPLSDFRATLYDGSFHTVDSNELSFKIAASMALKKGVHRLPAGAARADHGDRGSRPRGVHGRREPRPQHAPRPRPRDGQRRRHPGREAHVPQAELFSYATELRSMTRGRGTFTLDARPLRGGAPAPRREGDREPSQGDGGGRRAPLALSSGSMGPTDGIPCARDRVVAAAGAVQPRGRVVAAAGWAGPPGAVRAGAVEPRADPA